MKIIIVGASGMLGYTLFHALSKNDRYEIHGTLRSQSGIEQYFAASKGSLHEGVDVHSYSSLESLCRKILPDVIINCVGIIKQIDAAKLPVESVAINSLLPHKLASLATELGAKLIHFSTDCVFNGSKGAYREESLPDAPDLYGRSKLLGEVDYGGHLTLRTSIIGHELRSNRSLIDWFLSQNSETKGFVKAVFSGLPTIEVARVLDLHVLHNTGLNGLYHLSVEPINKYELLSLVAGVYGKEINIEKEEQFAIDRSLESSRFREVTGYRPPSWKELVECMHADYLAYYAKHRNHQ